MSDGNSWNSKAFAACCAQCALKKLTGHSRVIPCGMVENKNGSRSCATCELTGNGNSCVQAMVSFPKSSWILTASQIEDSIQNDARNLFHRINTERGCQAHKDAHNAIVSSLGKSIESARALGSKAGVTPTECYSHVDNETSLDSDYINVTMPPDDFVLVQAQDWEIIDDQTF